MIRSWRQAFNPPPSPPSPSAVPAQLPFVFAELDGFAGSNFAVIRGVQEQTALEVPFTRMAVNHDLGTLNDAGAKIHSPRKEELGRRVSLQLQDLVYSNENDAVATVAQLTRQRGGVQVQSAKTSTPSAVVTHGPVLVSAEATATAIRANFAASPAAETEVVLHGTAGCIGITASPPCCANGTKDANGGAAPLPPCCKPGKGSCLNMTCPVKIVGFRCCDISPFSVGWADPGNSTVVWQRHSANATLVDGLTVVLNLSAAHGLAPDATVANAARTPVQLRYNWEGFPNCAVYNGIGGPRAGSWNPRGGNAAGCEGYEGCVYEGTVLPAAPAQVQIGGA